MIRRLLEMEPILAVYHSSMPTETSKTKCRQMEVMDRNFRVEVNLSCASQAALSFLSVRRAVDENFPPATLCSIQE
jgi:hypothetical protein